MKCPRCGRFVKDAFATINGFEEIVLVEAKCAKHGTVNPTDWEADDFGSHNSDDGKGEDYPAHDGGLN